MNSQVRLNVKCECNCHTYHIVECGECLYIHHDVSKDELITYTESHIVDTLLEYLHRFGLPKNRICTYYYPLLRSNALQNIETVFYYKNIKFLDYLFKGKTPKRTKELFHRGILHYLALYHGYHDVKGLDEEHRVRWRII